MTHISDIPENILSTIEATFARHFMDMQLIRCTTNAATSTITLSFSFKDRHCDLTLYCSLEAQYTITDDSDIELSISDITLDTTLDSHNADIFYPAHRFWHPYPQEDTDTTNTDNPIYVLSPRQFTRGLIMAYTSEAEFHPQL